MPSPENLEPIPVSRRPWETPDMSDLDTRQTETTVTKWFTPDLHALSNNYGTPPS